MIPKIIVVIEGGMVQEVHSSGPAQVLVIDFDTDRSEQQSRNRFGEPCSKSSWSFNPRPDGHEWIDEEFNLP